MPDLGLQEGQEVVQGSLARWDGADGRRQEVGGRRQKGQGGLGVAEFLKGATVRPYGRAKFVRDCARFGF